MSRTTFFLLTGLAALFIAGHATSASAQRGLNKGGLVQWRYLTNEQRAARGWRSVGGGLYAVTPTGSVKSKSKKHKRIVRAT